MADETSDISNQEQLVFCIRWVDHDLNAQEEFMGMYEIPSTDANTLIKAIKDMLMIYITLTCYRYYHITTK